MYLLIILIIASMSIDCRAHFTTLTELNEYARVHTFYIKSTNNDINYPDFNSIYKKKVSRSWQFGFNKKPQWDAREFKKSIEQCRYLQENVLINSTLSLPPQSKCVVWGDLFGDMHSLINTLNYCANELKILNENLVITSKDIYFIFLGNTIGLTPYSLETLNIILSLMQKNQGNVFLLAGNMEEDGEWESSTMAQQLKYYAADMKMADDFGIPLQTVINSFFNSLPRLLRVHNTSQANGHQIIFSHNANAAQDDNAIDNVIISGESVFRLQQISGLQFMGYLQGQATWSLISCATQLYQHYFGFKQNSFAVINMGMRLDNTSITAYKKEVGNNNVFEERSFNITNGEPFDQQENSYNTYKVGSLLPLSGMHAVVGNAVYYGLNAGLHLKKNGSIEKLVIHDIMFDDESILERAVSALQRLEKLKIPVLLMPVGDSAFYAYQPLITTQQLYLLFPYSGNTFLRNPELKTTINLVPSHHQELTILIDSIKKNHLPHIVALVYPNDATGKDAYETAKKIFSQQDSLKIYGIAYTPGTTEFKEQIRVLKATGADTIGFLGNSSALKELIIQLEVEYLVTKYIFGLSHLNSIDLAEFIHVHGLEVVITSGGMPSPKDSSIALVKEYQDAMDTLGLPHDHNSLTGFIGAQLFEDALHHVKPPYKPSSIITHFEQLKNYEFKGLIFSFDPATRSLGLKPELVVLK